jgi:hypothetical protein
VHRFRLDVACYRRALDGVDVCHVPIVAGGGELLFAVAHRADESVVKMPMLGASFGPSGSRLVGMVTA